MYTISRSAAARGRAKKMRKLFPFCTARSRISLAMNGRTKSALAQNSGLLLDPIGAPTRERKTEQTQLQAASTFPSWVVEAVSKAPVQNSLLSAPCFPLPKVRKIRWGSFAHLRKFPTNSRPPCRGSHSHPPPQRLRKVELSRAALDSMTRVKIIIAAAVASRGYLCGRFIPH